MTYWTLLDLELDDWLDPTTGGWWSLPLCRPDHESLVLGDDFTEDAPAFAATDLVPADPPERILLAQQGLCWHYRCAPSTTPEYCPE